MVVDLPYHELTQIERNPLISRAAELEQFDTALNRLRHGDGPAIVDITGEAGIGKSRLVSELCWRASSRGLTVLRGRATEFEQHTPFLPFTDAFSDLDLHELSAVPDLLREPSPIVRGFTGDPCQTQCNGDRFALYRSTSALLAHLGRAGVVLALDDLHWADPASLELLDYLVRHPVRSSVLFVTARRDRQTSASLCSALTRGVDTGTVMRLNLGPLAEPECVEKLAPDLPRGYAVALYEASEGNPLYFLALLHAHRGGKPIRRYSGCEYRTAPVGMTRIPAGLQSLLLDELTPLAAARRRTIDAIAVLGDHATPAMVSMTTERGEAEIATDIRALTRRDLVRTTSIERLALRHPVIRALVYESIDSPRRTWIHRRAAAELRRAGASLADQALHVERSLTGWDPEAAAILIDAADQATPTAPATAAHWLEVVLRLLPDTPEHATRRTELTLRRARALGVSGGLKESRNLLHEVISTSDDPVVRADAVTLCAVMERHIGRIQEATALLRRELSRRPAPTQAAALRLELGSSALFAARYPDARADVERALDTARWRGDAILETKALALAAVGEAYEGETAAALEFAGQAAGLADAMTDGDLAGLCESLARLGWTEVFLEKYADAERHADRGLEIARRSGRIYVMPHLLLCKAYVDMQTCRLPTAMDLADEAETIARAIDSCELLTFALAFKAQILLLARPRGDTTGLAAAEEAVATAGRSNSWWETLAWSVLGASALVTGDPGRARDALLRAGGDELRRLQPSVRPLLLELLVSANLALGDLDSAQRWAVRAHAEADRLGLPTQRGAALRGQAAVAAHRGDSAAAAQLFAQAAKECARSGATLREAQSLVLGAPSMRAAGDTSRAAAMWHRGHRLASSGGAGLLVGLAEHLRPVVIGETPTDSDELAALTTREREIAQLVAEGLTSQAIATKLYLSRRTVETHVSRVYHKTGVSSRVGLATLVARNGAPPTAGNVPVQWPRSAGPGAWPAGADGG